MTALNLTIARDSAFIIQDAAAFALDGGGGISRFVRKSAACATVRAAVGYTGVGFLAPVVARQIDKHFADFDDFLSFAEPFLRQVSIELREKQVAQGFPATCWSFVVAGWSVRDMRPRAVCFDWDHHGDDLFRDDVDDTMSPFISPEDEARHYAAIVASGGMASFRPETHGLQLVEMQRRTRQTIVEEGVTRYAIGGHVEVTEITQHAVTQRVIHRWPNDKIGAEIEPRPMASVLQFARPPMNRRQRRAMAAQRAREQGRVSSDD